MAYWNLNIQSELTWEVVRKAGLGSYQPLRSGLTKDGNVGFRPLTQRC